MKILVINCGSSTLKFDLVETGEQEARSSTRLARGTVDRIGQGSSIDFAATGGPTQKRPAEVSDHRQAVAEVMGWLDSIRAADGSPLSAGIVAAGHRVVHGGSRFTAPTLITPEVMVELDELSELAPLHNPAAIQGIRAAREALGPGVPMVAVFDTAFHRTLPDYAYTYALPAPLANRLGIRRYGFHGTAHADMLQGYADLAGVRPEEATVITLQLGNGCSAAAITKGESVDTSMGFTPLEGLVMGTRSGDIDAGIIAFLADKAGMGIEDIDDLLNKQSGLLGISGTSSDMRDLLSAMPQDDRARLAVEVFCYRARKYVGAYLAVLGGADAVIFGGGIGEHSPLIRARICEGLEWCGLSLDPARNAAATGAAARISADDARIQAYVVPVDESVLIARYTVRLLLSEG